MAAAGGRVGVMQRVVDLSQYALKIAINVVVPESQNSKPSIRQAIIAQCVAARVGIEVMLASIDFDDEASLDANEIDDVAIARSLATEVESLASPRAQMNPQLHLLRGHVFAQAASGFVGHCPHPAACGGHPPPSGEGQFEPIS